MDVLSSYSALDAFIVVYLCSQWAVQLYHHRLWGFRHLEALYHLLTKGNNMKNVFRVKSEFMHVIVFSSSFLRLRRTSARVLLLDVFAESFAAFKYSAYLCQLEEDVFMQTSWPHRSLALPHVLPSTTRFHQWVLRNIIRYLDESLLVWLQLAKDGLWWP